jgi:hypothetical protein
MRVLGIAGLVLALAIVGYVVVSYLRDAGDTQEALRSVPGAPASGPVDPTRSGLEKRLSPVLEQERQRVEETDKAAGQ